jgi:hypothetical protein
MSLLRQKLSAIKNQVKWAFPAGRDKFEALIRYIQEAVNSFSEITSYQLLEEILSAVLLSRTNIRRELTDIVNAIEGTHPLLKNLAKMKKEIVEIETSIPKRVERSCTELESFDLLRVELQKPPADEMTVQELNAHSIQKKKDFTLGRSLNAYDRTLILCQWIDGSDLHRAHPSEIFDAMLLQKARIAAVALQLHQISTIEGISRCKPLIRTLDCCGFIYNYSWPEGIRFSYAYKFPPHILTTLDVQCVSLYEVISLRSRTPFLGDRLGLAISLVRTIFSTLLSGLFHKGFNSMKFFFLSKGLLIPPTRTLD